MSKRITWNTPSIESIKSFVKSYNYKLLSTEYIDRKSKLQFFCNIHNIKFEKSWINFRENPICPKCVKDKIRQLKLKSKEELQSIITKQNKNWILIDRKLINSLSTLTIKCSICNNIFERKLNDIRDCKYCPYCKKKQLKEKIEKENIEKYGIKNILYLSRQEKLKLFNQRKYGVDNVSQLKKIKEKKENTLIKNYSVTNPMDSNKIKDKQKENNIKKYGVENVFQNKEIKEKIEKTCLKKYGVDNYTKTKKHKLHCKNILQETNKKRYLTKKQNNTFHTSEPEDKLYKILNDKYLNVKRNYKSSLYPFACDFYIPELNLYIELNNHWTHGKTSFNKNNSKHIEILNEWKNRNTKYYNNAIYVWTISDLLKRNIAKQNNLNYLEIFKFINEEDVLNQIKRVL